MCVWQQSKVVEVDQVGLSPCSRAYGWIRPEFRALDGKEATRMVPRASEGPNRIHAKDIYDMRRIWRTLNVVRSLYVRQYRRDRYTYLARVRTTVSAATVLVILSQELLVFECTKRSPGLTFERSATYDHWYNQCARGRLSWEPMGRCRAQPYHSRPRICQILHYPRFSFFNR